MPIVLEGKKNYTTAECAEKIGVSKRRVLQFIEQDRLPARKISHAWYVIENDLERFMAIPRPVGNKTGRPRTPKKSDSKG